MKHNGTNGHDPRQYDASEKRKKSIRMIAESMKEMIPFDSASSILDFGAGTGLLTMEFYRSAQKVYALDLSSEMLEQLAQKIRHNEIQNIEIIHGNIEEISILPQVDNVISSNVFHHIQNREAVLSRLMDTLSRKGRIMIADIEEDGAAKGYGRRMMINLFQKLGLKRISHKTIHAYTKSLSDGTERIYTTFLLTGQK